jgi:hypothetical protein
VLRVCDPYEVDIPDLLEDRTGYVFEESGGAEADRLTVEVEDLPAAVTPAAVIAAARTSAARALDGDPGWPEGQIESGFGTAHTLAIAGPELGGAMWIAALRGREGRVWTLRFESAREGAEAVFAAIVGALGGGPAPPGWAARQAFAAPLALPAWLRPPRVYRFVSPGGETRCALDQGSADMPEESEFETWGEAAPGEVLVVHALGGGEAPLAGAEGVWGQWRLDRCDAYGGVLGSTWARVAASPGLSLRLVLIERDAETVGAAGFSAMAASVRRR